MIPKPLSAYIFLEFIQKVLLLDKCPKSDLFHKSVLLCVRSGEGAHKDSYCGRGIPFASMYLLVKCPQEVGSLACTAATIRFISVMPPSWTS